MVTVIWLKLLPTDFRTISLQALVETEASVVITYSISTSVRKLEQRSFGGGEGE